ncbi:AI-2E family transporter [Tamlana agarivorans]|uniref:AI-2E family transporter n=1 Tax=Pseudotamlana agarivorans TaxID=481183 RepID=A0ACC5U522_9FLAO|nr:AI-2E family transporter [Tamlana agarivorans]MBU2949379.1 AI-2E family transporter [Tamlana agarivorans]
MKTIDPKIIRQIFILLLIGLIGGLIFKEMAPYLSGVLGAIIMHVLLRKLMSKLVKENGWSPNWAAGLLMFMSFIVILLPIAGIVMMLGNKIGIAVDNSEKVMSAVQSKLDYFEKRFGYDLTSQLDTEAFSGWVSENLQGLVGGTFTTFITISIMYFLLYYMLTNRKQLKESLFDYIPISEPSLKIIGTETRQMVRANALGIPLVAIAQGIVALIGFLIFGVEDPFFWSAIVTFGSMIPFVGSMLGTIPVFILMLSQGNTFQAWGVLVYGLVIVGSTDNIIRLFVLRKLDDVHPLITLLGVIVGLPLFGFVGLIFGPLLISLFLIIVRIYKKEYSRGEDQAL